MADSKRYVIIGVVVAVIVLIVALVATSLQKLASDEGVTHLFVLLLIIMSCEYFFWKMTLQWWKNHIGLKNLYLIKDLLHNHIYLSQYLNWSALDLVKMVLN